MSLRYVTRALLMHFYFFFVFVNLRCGKKRKFNTSLSLFFSSTIFLCDVNGTLFL
ncbi:MAG: hypothetical protein ACJA1H_001101 [Glaciecola sp.]|jgi:hypothetical protein